MTIRRTSFWCRCCAVFVGLVLVAGLLWACRGQRTVPAIDDNQHVPVSRLAEDLQGTERVGHSTWATRYYDGYLAELLQGDMRQARAAYTEVIAEAGGDAPEMAARAALRLAELEALAGRRRGAIELMARASVLGRDHLDIVELADRLHARLSSLRTDGRQVRGPPLGTRLATASETAGERFAAAEELLEAYQRIRLRPRLEQLKTGVRTKEHAMGAAVRGYRSVIALNEPLAQVAAEFRIASLHHDLALSLMFDLPPELEPRAAAKLRHSLRTSALGYLEKARAAYSRAVQSRIAGPGQAEGERWSSAAALGLRSVEDLLGGGS